MKYIDVMRRSGFTVVLGAINILTILGVIFVLGALFKTISSIRFITYSSHDEIVNNFRSDHPIFPVTFGGIDLGFTDKLYDHIIINDEQIVSYLCFKLVIYLILLVIFLLLRLLMKSFTSNLIYTKRNGRVIEVIALLVFILSLLINSELPYRNAIVSSMLRLPEYMNKAGLADSFGFMYGEPNWGMMVGACVIWLIGRAFRYGAFLQEEYDATV